MKYQSDVDDRLSGHLSSIYCALIQGALDEADEVYRRFTSIVKDPPVPSSPDALEWIKISDR